MAGPTENPAAKQERERAAFKTAIESILNQDRAAGGAATSRQTAIEMSRIDLSQAPSDFQTLFVLHRQAWEESAALDDAWNRLTTDENFEKVLTGGILCGLIGCEENPIKTQVDAETRVKEARLAASQQIKETWHSVELSAASYGAAIPPK